MYMYVGLRLTMSLQTAESAGWNLLSRRCFRQSSVSYWERCSTVSPFCQCCDQSLFHCLYPGGERKATAVDRALPCNFQNTPILQDPFLLFTLWHKTNTVLESLISLLLNQNDFLIFLGPGKKSYVFTHLSGPQMRFWKRKKSFPSAVLNCNLAF